MFQKKIWLVMLLFLSISSVSAVCKLTPALINQDPVYAIPGESVKVILQIKGVEDPACGNIIAEFIEETPFSLAEGYEKKITLTGGTYVRDFNSFLILPYKLKVSSEALEGDQPFKLSLSGNNNLVSSIYEFNLSVEDVRTDFVVTIDSYSYSTNELSLGLINIGDKDAKSITAEIPTQDSVYVEGSHTKIIGDLNSNEDTTVTFTASPNDGEINVILQYNDENDIRRTISKKVLFSGSSFEKTRKNYTPSISLIFLSAVVISLIIYIILSRRKRKKHDKSFS